jgi:hypothetical protein
MFSVEDNGNARAIVKVAALRTQNSQDIKPLWIADSFCQKSQ